MTLIYTFEGGIAAVIWTDLIQLIIYIGGSLVAAYMLLTLVPGGWSEIYAQGAAAGKFQVFSFNWSLQSAVHLLGRTLWWHVSDDGLARNRSALGAATAYL